MKFQKILLGTCILSLLSSASFAGQQKQTNGTLKLCDEHVHIVDVEMGIPADGYNHFTIGYNDKPVRDSNTKYIRSESQLDSDAGRAMYHAAFEALTGELFADIYDDGGNCETFDAIKVYAIAGD